MAIPILGDILNSVFGKVGDVVGEIVVDKDKRNQLNADLERLRIEGIQAVQLAVHQEIMGQLAINEKEAQHSSIFVAGWRPFVGWVSGVGLAYVALIEPFLSWVARVNGYVGEFPQVDNNVLLFALGGMLGIGAMRTVEKVKGVSTDVVADSPAASRNVPSPVVAANKFVGSTDQMPEDAPWRR